MCVLFLFNNPMETGSTVDLTATTKKTSFNQVKGLLQRCDGNWKDICKMLAGLLLLMVVCLAVIALPIAEIVVGSVHIHQCPVDSRVPIYLIVTGVTVLIIILFVLLSVPLLFFTFSLINRREMIIL